MTWAHIERFGSCERQCSGVMRIFDDGQQFGDKYRYSFSFRMVDDATIELYGIVGRAPTIGEVRALATECRRRGWKVIWDRKCGARPGKHEQE